MFSARGGADGQGVKAEAIVVVPQLPKTRSGKVMRRVAARPTSALTRATSRLWKIRSPSRRSGRSGATAEWTASTGPMDREHQGPPMSGWATSVSSRCPRGSVAAGGRLLAVSREAASIRVDRSRGGCGILPQWLMLVKNRSAASRTRASWRRSHSAEDRSAASLDAS